MQRLIGESSTLVETLTHVSRVAPLNRPILVIGERGSGKEIIAERIHYLSGRWQENFDKVNCAAISDTLLDSELFGHEAGAFTGANKRHIGRFERVDGGTLFLDELGTLPLRIQEKLLRVIEYGELERLGGTQTLNVDVRIVGATHADLPMLVEQGKFRADFLDRLAFDVIQVPPLRERMEDLEALVDHFASKMSVELEHSNYPGFSEAALEALRAHSWPGNIRELRNVVERSLCHWQELEQPVDEVSINPFPNTNARAGIAIEVEAHDQSTSERTIQNELTTDTAINRNFHELVKDTELKLIRQALERNQYHQERSAEYLGLSYHQLRALLRKYKAEL